VEPVLVVAVVALSVLFGEQVAVLVGHRLGDQTAERAGRLWSPQKLSDLLGTVLIPSLLAVVSQGPLLAFGWGRPGPVGPASLTGWRAIAAATAAPVAHLVLGAMAVAAHVALAGSGSSVGLIDVTIMAGQTNLIIAGFLLLPAPPLPGGRVLGMCLRGESATRWARWGRWSRAPFGLAMAGFVAWLVSEPTLHRFG
jgi:Zn-dependent protease